MLAWAQVILSWAVLGLLGTLATARLTRLIIHDEITKPLRRQVLRRLDPEREFDLMVAYLLDCGWCMSIWVAGALAAGTWAFWSHFIWWLVLSAVVASQVTGMLGDVSFYLRNRHQPVEDESKGGRA